MNDFPRASRLHSRRIPRGRPLPVWLPVLLALAIATPAVAELRQWTDDQGRVVEAELLGVEEDNAQLRLPNGNVSRFPLDRLSAEDQAWVAEWLAGADDRQPSPVAGPAMPAGQTRFSGDWPTSISVGTSIDVEVVREDADAGEFIYRSPHFEFHSDAQLRTNVVREFARLYEVTYAAVEQLPLDLKPEPPEDGHYVTRLFTEMDAYHAAGGLPGSAGVYVPRTNEVLVPLESLGLRRVGSGFTIEARDENHTLIHEITHQLTRHWRGMPVWLYEGLAEYVASAVYRPGRLTFTNRMSSAMDYMRNYKGVWERSYTAVSPAAMMDMSYQQWSANIGGGRFGGVRNYASALILTVFYCHHDDDGSGQVLWNYLRALENGVDEKQARDQFLIRGRSADDLESEISRAWRRGRLDLSFDQRPAPVSGPVD